MIDHLQQVDRVIAAYLTDGKITSSIPSYVQLFNQEDLLKNWDGALLPPHQSDDSEPDE